MVERYRQMVAPVMPDTGLMDGGGQSLADQLGRAAKTVGDTAYSYGAALRGQQGATDGDKAGKNAKPRTGFAALSPYGQAYNSAAEASYAAEVQLDVDATINRFATDYEGKPDDFNAVAGKYAEDLNATVPEAYRPFVDKMLRAKIAKGNSLLYTQQKIRQENQALATHVEGMASGAKMAVDGAAALPGAEGDEYLTGFVAENRRRLEALSSAGVITATDVVKYDDQFRTAVDNGLQNAHIDEEVQYLTALERESTGRAAAHLASVLEREDLSAEEKDKIQAGWEAAADNNRKIKAVVYRDRIAAVGQRLAAGETSPGLASEIRALNDAGAITTTGMADKLSSMTRNAKEAADKAAAAKKVTDGTLGDPESKEFREGVDSLFGTAMADGGMTLGSPEANTLAVDMLRQWNVLPEVVSQQVRVRALSGTPEEKALAATFYKQASDVNPLAFKWTGEQPKLGSYLIQLAENVEAAGPGADVTAMAERVHKNVFEVSTEQRALLTTRLQKEKIIDGNPSALKNAIDASSSNRSMLAPVGGSSGLAIPNGALAEYNRLFETVYMTSDGDVNLARREAGRAVTATWRYTDVNGEPKLLKHAPQMDTDVLREDMHRDLDDVGFVGDKSRVRLAPTTETESSKGRVWTLVPVDEYGSAGAPVIDPETRRAIRYEVPSRKRQDEARALYQQRMKNEAAADFVKKDRDKAAVDAVIQQRQEGLLQ